MIKTSFTSNEIQAMIDSAPELRDKVVLSFYGDTGARLSELLMIKIEHIDFEGGMVLIPHLKRGSKRRKCPNCNKSSGYAQQYCGSCGGTLPAMNPEMEQRSRLINVGQDTLDLIKLYLKTRTETTDYLINLSRQWIYQIVRRAAESIGLEGKCILNPSTGKKHFPHPHNFRDSLAVDWLTIGGADIGKQKALQDHLGHVRFDTTMRYFKLTPHQVKKVSDEIRQKRFSS